MHTEKAGGDRLLAATGVVWLGNKWNCVDTLFSEAAAGKCCWI